MQIFKRPAIKYDLSKIEDKSIQNAFIEEKKIIPVEKNIKESNTKKKPIIEIKDLVKSFGHGDSKFTAVNGISFNINEGEHIALLGGNGAGKTTTVEIVAGLNKPTSGTINYHLGQEYSFKEKIGIQFQDSSYPVGVSVKDVISFVKKISKIKVDNNKLNALIHIFGIDEFYYKKASSLSGGQQQRLNCLLSILNYPKFLILDEISTGLDVTIRTRIKKFIKDFAKEHNITILIISHDMEEVEYMADRIIIMNKGTIYVDMLKSDIIKKFGSISKCLDMYI